MSKLLVTIEKIIDIQPIIGADRIVLATVKGWNSIIGKDTFKVGDKCIFIPIDAVIPDKLIEEQKLEYLRGNNRIRTIKLKGTISQGLILPLSILDKYSSNQYVNTNEGSDVSKILNITKYEPPVKNLGTKKEYIKDYWAKYLAKEITLRHFVAKSVGIIKTYLKRPKLTNPEFKVYTDINNVKHYPNVFEEGELVVINEKIHGTSFRAGYVPIKQTLLNKLFNKGTHEFVYGSHNVQKTCLSGKGFYEQDVYGQIAELYKLADILPKGYVLYGEIYGKKIQELTYGMEGINVVFFDLKKDDKYVDYMEFYEFCVSRNLPIVPMLYFGIYNKNLLKIHTDEKTTLGNNLEQIREGCVIKPQQEKFNNSCGRKILKSISADYLLKRKVENPEEFVDDSDEFLH